jgi:hypothetical protein
MFKAAILLTSMFAALMSEDNDEAISSSMVLLQTVYRVSESEAQGNVLALYPPPSRDGTCSEKSVSGFGSRAKQLKRLFTEVAEIVKRSFADRKEPVIMVGIYQCIHDESCFQHHNNLTAMLNNFAANANQAASAAAVNMSIVAVNLNRASYDSCSSSPTLSNVQVECLNFAHWLEQVSGPYCDLEAPLVFMARSMVYSQAVEVSREGVLLLGLDVVLHQDLLGWIKENRQQHTEIMSATAFGNLNTGSAEGGFKTCNRLHTSNDSVTYNITCLCGDVIFADHRSSQLVEAWAAQNIHFRKEQFGDQDSLNDLVVSKGWHDRVEVIPPAIAGQCGHVGEYATHYNCCKNKVESMKENGHWLL